MARVWSSYVITFVTNLPWLRSQVSRNVSVLFPCFHRVRSPLDSFVVHVVVVAPVRLFPNNYRIHFEGHPESSVSTFRTEKTNLPIRINK